MDAWLGPGIEPSEAERRGILSQVTLCSLTTSNVEGALRTRTAMIERVATTGRTLTVRVMGSGLYDDVIPNPRIVISALPALGVHAFIAVNGLARIHSRTPAGADREQLLLLEVTIQRMECWSLDGAREALKAEAADGLRLSGSIHAARARREARAPRPA